MNERVAIVSLGCDKNTVDAERMAFLLCEDGFVLSDDPFDADAVVVNTCGFIEAAKKEAIERIFDAVRAKQEGRIRAVIVTGCLAQRYFDELKAEIPELDAVVSVSFDMRIASVVRAALEGEKSFLRADECVPPDGCGRLVSTPPHYAYLKIADGCSNHCTYCAIPSIRGPYVSRGKQAIIDEARELAQQGVKELILVAQDTTAYGRDDPQNGDFCGLLRDICAIQGIERVRILYAYPDGITDELVSLIASNPKIAKYIDVPLQHCNDEVLHRMARRAPRADIEQVLNKLREAVDGIAIRTTFIAGFPGETAAQFEELCEFAAHEGFARAGCFAFSREEGTSACLLDKHRPLAVRQKRAEILSATLYEGFLRFQRSLVGKTLLCVCDVFDEARGVYVCRTEYDTPDVDSVVLVAADAKLSVGNFAKLRITDEKDGELLAELAN